jgi:hypothetical protein
MRRSLYFLVVWILFAHHELVKYPQADYFVQPAGSYWHPENLSIMLYDVDSEPVIAIPWTKIYKIDYHLRDEARKYGYRVYVDPRLPLTEEQCHEKHGNRWYYIDPRIFHKPGDL